MKAIVVMFDSLNRRYLPPYGAQGVHAPNFERLAQRTATFDTCYAGSMPCIPARREMHTGRYNFLHRGWGPLEPFDDSVPEMLKAAGVHTHLATDHQHYWEDGGATFHNRYSTYEFFRGQEGDFWKGQVADPPMPADLKRVRRPAYRQDWVNRQHLTDEADHPQTLTFDAGLEFIDTNAGEDRWMVQIEAFDPHEPFFSYDRYADLYPEDHDGPHRDWPDYAQVLETRDQAAHLRRQYKALLSMCDRSLGRVLDRMDALDLWEDTMLMVVTDHGFLLGEHGWWGKNIPPWYEETIHTPLFVWDPRSRVAGQRRSSLVQTIDIGPTLLEFFDVDRTPDMEGRPLRGVVEADEPVRTAGLFGGFGGHVNVTDGRYVYMRAPVTAANEPLAEYTLMPTHMMSRFTPAELRSATLAPPFRFTKDVPTLRTGGAAMGSPFAFGTLLFDLATDPEQRTPLVDDELEARMVGLMLELMRANDAPPEQYQRLGLPPEGPADEGHLLVRRHWPQVEAARTPVRREEYPAGLCSANTPLRELLADPAATAVVGSVVPGLLREPMRTITAPLSPVEVAAFAVGLLPVARLRDLSDGLAALSADR
ncbi:sulfatase [Klenkia sp. LSe6-5]|uniref:Sulfatase n=1 Tax=Klenkia sesuvii TaxID=3103137 RepID=A0ABU8DYW7_9ACTN